MIGGKPYDAVAMVSLLPGAHISRTVLLRGMVGPLKGGPSQSPWVTGDMPWERMAWSGLMYFTAV